VRIGRAPTSELDGFAGRFSRLCEIIFEIHVRSLFLEFSEAVSNTLLKCRNCRASLEGSISVGYE
jgi:hypothetical protein